MKWLYIFRSDKRGNCLSTRSCECKLSTQKMGYVSYREKLNNNRGREFLKAHCSSMQKLRLSFWRILCLLSNQGDNLLWSCSCYDRVHAAGKLDAFLCTALQAMHMGSDLHASSRWGCTTSRAKVHDVTDPNSLAGVTNKIVWHSDTHLAPEALVDIQGHCFVVRVKGVWLSRLDGSLKFGGIARYLLINAEDLLDEMKFPVILRLIKT